MTLAGELHERYKSLACKNREDDDYLSEKDLYWCRKNKKVQSTGGGDCDYCPHYACNGDKDLIVSLDQPKLQLGIDNE